LSSFSRLDRYLKRFDLMIYRSAIYISGAKRTAIGSMLGALSEISAPTLAAQVIEGLVSEKEAIDQVILGCVLSAGVGQAPARQAALKAGLPKSVNALTINKVCSSGLKAVVLAANEIELGVSSQVVAGGMENMSLAPFILPKLRAGAKLGHTAAEDTIVRDGLWDVYNDIHMGSCAELCASKFGITREQQDNYALQSYDRAAAAIQSGSFADEIVGIQTRAGIFVTDEEVGKLKREKVGSLKPVFQKDGTITAASSSSISDGAACLLVASENAAKNSTPLARIVAHNTHSQEPELFGLAPIGAIEKLLSENNLSVSDIDLFEINEAFASVALACQQQLNIPTEKLNISGGAIALGHPIGASGARILVTLLHGLRRTGGKRGIVGICNGGGEATALLVELV